MAILASPITRAHAPDLMERGVRKNFLLNALKEKAFSRIYNVDSSEKRQETDVVSSSLGSFYVKEEGDGALFDTMQEAYVRRFLHSTYALGVEITEEAVDDELYGLFNNIGAELGRSAAYTQEVAAAAPFNDLSATVYTAEGTNYTLLSTAQYLVTGGTWSNTPAVATDLSIDSLEAALSAWNDGMVDLRGRRLSVRPKYLVVGMNDEWLARALLGSIQRPGGANNDINAIRERELQVFVWPFLTNDGRWFLLGDKSDIGLQWFNRKRFAMRRGDDPNSGNMKMVGRYRASYGLTHVSGVYGSS